MENKEEKLKFILDSLDEAFFLDSALSMKFEHLIEINNPQDFRITALTHLQLWQGLVLRAEEPTLFLPQLVSCTIIERTENRLSRRLKFGKLIVLDQVYYNKPNQIRFHVPEQNEILASTLETLT